MLLRLLYKEASLSIKPIVPSLLFSLAVSEFILSKVAFTLAIVASTSSPFTLLLRLDIIVFAPRIAPRASVTPLFAFTIMPLALSITLPAFAATTGKEPLTCASKVLSSRVEVVRLAVILSILCTELWRAGSARSVFTLPRMLSNFGNIFWIEGTILFKSPKVPSLITPSIHPLGSKNFVLLPNCSTTFTLPMMSLTISAVVPSGILNVFSTSISTVIDSPNLS